MRRKWVGLSAALAVVGALAGYLTSLPFLATAGELAAAALGAVLGLILARALWITRPDGDPQRPDREG